MKFVDFPILGRRPVTEFTCSGVLTPEPATLGATAPGAWVFDRNSVPMRRTEWWYHTPTQLWFTVERDTGTDTVYAVALARRGDHG